jgi:hypothetical protein
MRDVYDIVRDFFRDGPPASRNVAFEAYQDERFARAVRIYHYLASVRDQVLELTEAGDDVAVDVAHEDRQVVLRVRYQRGQLRRTAYLKPEEWELLMGEPRLAELLSPAQPG